MTYICIHCRKVWTVGDRTDYYSGGVCEKCITRYIRDKQKGAGFHDCFARATDICNEIKCCYRQTCLKVSGVK